MPSEASRGAAVNLARVTGARKGVIMDGVLDDDTCNRLFDAVAAGAERATTRGILRGTQVAGIDPPAERKWSRGSGDQTNSVAFLSEKYVLKLFRRIEPGPNPEFELSSALFRQGFHRTPALNGALAYDRLTASARWVLIGGLVSFAVPLAVAFVPTDWLIEVKTTSTTTVKEVEAAKSVFGMGMGIRFYLLLAPAVLSLLPAVSRAKVRDRQDVEHARLARRDEPPALPAERTFHQAAGGVVHPGFVDLARSAHSAAPTINEIPCDRTA